MTPEGDSFEFRETARAMVFMIRDENFSRGAVRDVADRNLVMQPGEFEFKCLVSASIWKALAG